MNGLSYGFIGLGQMGGPMASNITSSGYNLSVFDKVEIQKHIFEDINVAISIDQLVSNTDTIFLSLPDASATLEVANKIVAANESRTAIIIDLSTIGIEASQNAWKILNEAGITYIDAPVSGGQSGAKAGTITIMWAGPQNILEDSREVMMSFCKNLFHVGKEAGQGQALKILNNFLSATAMAATSEAMAFGLSQGLDMKTMLNVVNLSTGQNTATIDKFPNRILTGTYDAGFKTKLLTKDMQLFLDSAKSSNTPLAIAEAVMSLWHDCNDTFPDSDFTQIYKFIIGKKEV
jgi:3-hydroxyisobutyrate dehydrogenase-like beta-hydroxyacid dehydrogenase